MKKKMFAKISILGCLCLCLTCGMLACTKDNKPNVNISNYTIDVPYKDNFQVLQLTDTHWLGGTD